MLFSSSTIAFLSLFTSYTLAAPYNPFPLPDGFPSPNPTQLNQISKAAGGSLPNSPLPTSLTPDGVTTLQLIALNEIFEVAFFTDLLYNVTNKVPGYEDTGDFDRDYVIDALTAIQNQEKLHYLGANGILASANATQIQPCKYTFPTTSFSTSIALANTFTDVVIGVLPLAQTTFASDGGDETGLVGLVGSIIAQESEQNGWYRSVQKKVPSAAPFLTTEGPAFAFTFLQGVIVPGSCPNIELISDKIPTFGALNVLSKPTSKNSTITYSITSNSTSQQPLNASSNSLVYISGQNLPITVPIKNIKSHGDGKETTFEAELPFDSDSGLFAKGLTIAAVVSGTSGERFMNSSDVAGKTVYGPGIIEID